MKDIFCTKEQTITPHKASIDGNGEFLFQCTTCDRFLKLPADTKPEDLDTLLASRQAANEGQVSVEEQEKKLAEMLASSA